MCQEARWVLRVTINFCIIIKHVINDAYMMHRVEGQLVAMSGSSVFTTVDLTKGYHPMKLAESSKEITAFSSPKGLFQWKVLPMSMKTSGAVLQHLMDIILGNLQPRCAVVYLLTTSLFLVPLLVNILLTWVKYLSGCQKLT